MSVETGAQMDVQSPRRLDETRYFVTTPSWLGNPAYTVFCAATGRAIASFDTEEQAMILRDTLNLACGCPPSRRLLDAVHQGV